MKRGNSKTKLYPVAEDDRELVVEEESRYKWHTWISYDDEDDTSATNSYFGAADRLPDGGALLVDTGAYDFKSACIITIL